LVKLFKYTNDADINLRFTSSSLILDSIFSSRTYHPTNMAETLYVLSCNQVWRACSDDPDDAIFDHRAIAFPLGGKHFHARDFCRKGDIDLYAANAEEIPLEHF
jgi:hypothetical protein